MDDDSASGFERRRRLILLIDHANVRPDHTFFQHVLRDWLDGLGEDAPPSGLLSVRVRAYGGWYRGSSTSDERFGAARVYQQACPSLMKHRQWLLQMSFAFAEEVIAEGDLKGASHYLRISNTVVERASPQTFRMRGDSPECSEPDCRLREVTRWLKKRRACAKPGCPHSFAAFFVRREQKQVDVHLAVDLIACTLDDEQCGHVAVATDDLDIVPALLHAATRNSRRTSLSLLKGDGASDALPEEALVALGVKVIHVT